MTDIECISQDNIDQLIKIAPEYNNTLLDIVKIIRKQFYS